MRQLFIADIQTDGAVGDIDIDGVAFIHQGNGAAFCRFRRGVADGQAGGAAGETAISQQCAFLAQPFGFQVAGGVEHFLHARAAFGAFVANHHHVAGNDLITKDGAYRRVLGFEDPGAAGELEDGIVHPGGFHDAAALGDVAVQHGQAAVLAVGVFVVADAAVFAVVVQAVPTGFLAEGGLGGDACRPGGEHFFHAFILGANDVVMLQGLGHGR